MKKLVVILFILTTSLLPAQEKSQQLKLQEVIERVLANNYGLRIAKNDSAAMAIENEFKKTVNKFTKKSVSYLTSMKYFIVKYL